MSTEEAEEASRREALRAASVATAWLGAAVPPPLSPRTRLLADSGPISVEFVLSVLC